MSVPLASDGFSTVRSTNHVSVTELSFVMLSLETMIFKVQSSQTWLYWKCEELVGKIPDIRCFPQGTHRLKIVENKNTEAVLRAETHLKITSKTALSTEIWEGLSWCWNRIQSVITDSFGLNSQVIQNIRSNLNAIALVVPTKITNQFTICYPLFPFLLRCQSKDHHYLSALSIITNFTGLHCRLPRVSDDGFGQNRSRVWIYPAISRSERIKYCHSVSEIEPSHKTSNRLIG